MSNAESGNYANNLDFGSELQSPVHASEHFSFSSDHYLDKPGQKSIISVGELHIGGSSVQDLQEKLLVENFILSDNATKIVSLSKTAENYLRNDKIKVAKCRISQLGLGDTYNYFGIIAIEDIVYKLHDIGADLLSLEEILQFRIKYKDQPTGELLRAITIPETNKQKKKSHDSLPQVLAILNLYNTRDHRRGDISHDVAGYLGASKFFSHEKISTSNEASNIIFRLPN